MVRTVDGRTPAPAGMYKTHQNPVNNGINYQPHLGSRISSINNMTSIKHPSSQALEHRNRFPLLDAWRVLWDYVGLNQQVIQGSLLGGVGHLMNAWLEVVLVLMAEMPVLMVWPIV